MVFVVVFLVLAELRRRNDMEILLEQARLTGIVVERSVQNVLNRYEDVEIKEKSQTKRY